MANTHVLQIPEPWCVVDQTEAIVRANAACMYYIGYDLTGYMAHDVLGAEFTAALDRVRRTGQPELVDNAQILRWCLTKSDGEVHCLGLSRTSEELDSPMRTEADSEAKQPVPPPDDDLLGRYQLAFEGTRQVMYDWDAKSDTMSWTTHGAKAFGYSSMSALSRTEWWQKKIHADDVAAVIENFHQTIAKKKRLWHARYRFLCTSGQYAWSLDRAIITYDRFRVVRIVGTVEDISRSLRFQAQRNLKSRLAAWNVLACGIAHEINNPLSWLVPNLDFAIKTLQQSQGKHEEIAEVINALHDVRTGTQRITQIVSDLRTFAHREEDGAFPVAINRAVGTAFIMARSELPPNHRLIHEFRIVPMALGDEALLCQAVFNLLSHTMRSPCGTPDGIKEVRVSTATDIDGNIVIEVKDTDAAFSKSKLSSLLHPLSSNPMKENPSLSLFVAHDIIRGMGGSIDIESTLDRSTTYRIVLPVLQTDLKDRAPWPVPVQPLRKGKVVIIDDEIPILTALQRMLEPSCDVRCFSRGMDAVHALAEYTPDVIFCDLLMPELLASELYQLICQAQPALASRVVFMTGGAFANSSREFLRKIQATVLKKPFSFQQVVDLVTTYLTMPSENN